MSIVKRISFLVITSLYLSSFSVSQGFEGYYQYPDIHNNTIAFCAEGDLWTVSTEGGLAQRITTHPEEELYPVFSPDGSTIAYTASYEGPSEIYTIPSKGGLTTRWTYENDPSISNTWTPDGKIVYAARAYSRVPDYQLVTIDPTSKIKDVIPLYQSSEGDFSSDGNTVYFVRPAYHRNVTKRYVGGTARQIWKYELGSDEAIKLTNNYDGESHHPMWYEGRVYFITDRDGVMNIWSMTENGEDLKQHTEHKTFDVRYAKLDEGKIVYQHAADLYIYDINSNVSNKIDIKLVSDLDQLREKWEDNPSQYITSVNPDPTGERIAITTRGRIFIAPVKSGRFIPFTRQSEVRYRDAIFSHDGKSIYALSDKSGEFEFTKLPSDGIGTEINITNDGKILRYEGIPSPNGKHLAYTDLAQNVFVLDLATGTSKKINTNNEGAGDVVWAPDSKWLAFEQSAFNTMSQIHIYSIESGETFPLTTDRANSMSPAWSPDGKFIYFLSDRNFESLVRSPWGTRQPEPYFDASEKVYHIALRKGTRSPFKPKDELFEEKKEDKAEDNVIVKIDKQGIQERIQEIPVDPGNYYGLEMNDKALYLLMRTTGVDAKTHLGVIKIDNEDVKIKTMAEDVNGFDLTQDGKKLLIRKSRNYYMAEAGTGKISDLNESKIDLSGWKFPIDPREEWKQMFTDAWRMERDYFYDKNMHGVDWDAMYNRYLPLVDRVTTRSELSDLIGRFVGELSALHTSVRGGDMRSDEQNIRVAALGGQFTRVPSQNGYRIDYIYQADPDYPDERGPIDDPNYDIRVGDVITQINGVSSLEGTDLGELIREEAGNQVRLTISRNGKPNDFIVQPLSSDYNLRYRDWEYKNRLKVEELSKDSIGYLHLRAMGSNDINQFYREFYPVFNRQGLIVDVRYNFGGNIDSFILEKLLRKAWMYWKGRSGEPYWNMPYSFRGHIVVLVNENTYSDGEAFADGFKKLELGTTIGMRTWGGEIWLNSANRLSDNGLARAPMFGVYGENGEWLIEGRGFEPDIEIDNLPHETFEGKDAQLEKAIEFLKEKMKEEPTPVPPVPDYPDKSFEYEEN